MPDFDKLLTPFTADEALAGFAILNYMVTGEIPFKVEGVLPTLDLQEGYAKLTHEYLQSVKPGQ